nr:hypothetical protein [Planococcus glaciei]
MIQISTCSLEILWTLERFQVFINTAVLQKSSPYFPLMMQIPTLLFYWKTYAPMMESILAKTEQKQNSTKKETAAVAQAEQDGISYPSRINGQTFEVYQDNKWQPFTVKGVNMGMAKPGTFPGEAAITREEYDRWFEQIGEMNANAIRVYTLHPPAFYDALKSYNEKAETPLYLYHGVWVDEEPLVEKLDAFDKDITQNFQNEMKKIVDVVHGNATVEEKTGPCSRNV